MILPILHFALLAAVARPDAPILPEAFAPARQDDAAGEEEEDPGWEGSATVGVSVTDGNSDITKASATIDATKKVEKERYTLGFSWNFLEEEGDVTQRKTYGEAQYDRFLSEKLYWLVQGSAEADEAANVDLRTTLGAGVGYQFADSEKWKLSGEAGLSWFNEEFGDGTEDDYIAARLAYKWAYEMNDRWSFEQSGKIFPSLEDSEDIYSRVDTRAKATLTESMFAQLQWVWDWDNTPAAGNERSDHLYLVTVGWKF